MSVPDPGPPLLVLGPLLRHVDPVSATVWVETDRACEVAVLGRRARTFCVTGHHYALVVVEGLEPGGVTPYEGPLDGERVGPARPAGLPRAPPPPPPPPPPAAGAARALPHRVRFLPLRHPEHRRRRRGHPARRAGHLRRAAPGAAGGGVARRAGAAGRPGLRRRAHALDPRVALTAPAAAGPAGRPGRRLRGVHPALRGVLERPAGALADVDHPVLDDLRRPRDDRRLEPLRRLAPRGDRPGLVDPPDLRRPGQ